VVAISPATDDAFEEESVDALDELVRSRVETALIERSRIDLPAAECLRSAHDHVEQRKCAKRAEDDNLDRQTEPFFGRRLVIDLAHFPDQAFLYKRIG